jgi:hypothetical protein
LNYHSALSVGIHENTKNLSLKGSPNMAAPTIRGWSKLSPEEKIHALWQDSNFALDDIESQEKHIKALEKTLVTLCSKR